MWCGPVFAAATTNDAFQVRDLIPFVDQRIGIQPQMGKCSLGVSLPFGSIRPCPHTVTNRDIGYDLNDKITGFSNINAGSVYKYMNLLLSPQIGLDCWDETGRPTGHDSARANEIIQPDYYAVDLTRYGIRAEITAAEHAAIYRLTYPETTNGGASLVLYPSHAMWAKSTFSALTYNPQKNAITGHLVISDGWYYARGREVHFVIGFSKPVRSFGTFDNATRTLYAGSNSISGEAVGCFLKFDTAPGEKVQAKLSISTKSLATAEAFLANEIPGWDFDQVKNRATEIWNKALSSILIDDPAVTADEKTVFYTALYHTLVSPKNRTGDCPWDYAGPYYDDQLCVWDTFRTALPLHTLLHESVVRDVVQSYCAIYKQNGYAPDAWLCGQGDMVQGGDDVDVLIADAYAKGIPGINWTDAYALLKGHATVSGRTPAYQENDRGWVPYGSVTRMSYATASKTMEFAYNDFCLAEVAAGLGYRDDERRFRARSGQWTNLWNQAVSSEGFNGFIQSKDINGDWVALDPAQNPRGSFSLHFYEGNSWTYSFYVPHQLDKLIQMMGGKETFIRRLQHYVGKKLEIDNEPCFLTPYLFAWVGRPDLTAAAVKKIGAQFTRAGYPGDDDSGAMSSWFIFSRLGFFPVAGQDLYLINGPHYAKVILQMENGKKITIHGAGASSENKYVQSARLNGAPLERAWFRHGAIKGGAELRFEMGPRASAWGTAQP